MRKNKFFKINWKTKKNEKYDLRVGFDDTFTANNYILSIVSWDNGMIGRMVKNFISKETNVFKNI